MSTSHSPLLDDSEEPTLFDNDAPLSDALCSLATHAINFPTDLPRENVLRTWNTLPQDLTTVYFQVTQSYVSLVGGMLYGDSDFLLDCQPFCQRDSYVCKVKEGGECAVEEFCGALCGWHLQLFTLSRGERHLWRLFYQPTDDLLSRYRALCVLRDGGRRPPLPVEFPLAMNNRRLYEIMTKIDVEDLVSSTNAIRVVLKHFTYNHKIITAVRRIALSVKVLQRFARSTNSHRLRAFTRMINEWNISEEKTGARTSDGHKRDVIEAIWKKRKQAFRQSYTVYMVQLRLAKAKAAASPNRRGVAGSPDLSVIGPAMHWMIEQEELAEVSTAKLLESIHDMGDDDNGGYDEDTL
eukprot:PhF_6_TR35483/c0_g1_i1/m.51748